MKILIPGLDGYIGWALTLRQLSLGNEVCGIDNFSRRKNVEEMNSYSALPILSIEQRINFLEKKYPGKISFYEGDLLDSQFTDDVVKRFSPDAVVHLGEQPSAPYSMMDQEHTISTQKNNVIGNLNLIHSMKKFVPNAHLVKLGTLGEYGYSTGLEIAEGFFEIEFRGKKATIPYPKLPGSWYHLTKVHDSNNIMFACKLWGLRCTDIMQGIVYGTRTHEITNENEFTRYDFDEAFGTVINRFCAQAVIGYPLTVYGLGGQTRGFLALVDCIQCISILLENPPSKGEYRVVNQFAQQYSVRDLAERVQKVAKTFDLDVTIDTKENPRKEMERHYYKVDHEKLKELGFKNTRTVEEEIELILQDLIEYKDRIESKKDIIFKGIKWVKK